MRDFYILNRGGEKVAIILILINITKIATNIYSIFVAIEQISHLFK